MLRKLTCIYLLETGQNPAQTGELVLNAKSTILTAHVAKEKNMLPLKVAVTIFIGVVLFILIVNLSAYLSVKFTNWLDRREESKWDMNQFSIPPEIPEFKPYNFVRGITRSNGQFIFTFKAAGNESTRNYYYKNPKEALKHYAKDFQKEERAFFERSKDDLLEYYSASKLVERVQAQADRIEADLNQLKQSLGEKND